VSKITSYLSDYCRLILTLVIHPRLTVHKVAVRIIPASILPSPHLRVSIFQLILWRRKLEALTPLHPSLSVFLPRNGKVQRGLEGRVGSIPRRRRAVEVGSCRPEHIAEVVEGRREGNEADGEDYATLVGAELTTEAD